jgi:hypothetical protein
MFAIATKLQVVAEMPQSVIRKRKTVQHAGTATTACIPNH